MGNDEPYMEAMQEIIMVITKRRRDIVKKILDNPERLALHIIWEEYFPYEPLPDSMDVISVEEFKKRVGIIKKQEGVG